MSSADKEPEAYISNFEDEDRVYLRRAVEMERRRVWEKAKEKSHYERNPNADEGYTGLYEVISLHALADLLGIEEKDR